MNAAYKQEQWYTSIVQIENDAEKSNGSRRFFSAENMKAHKTVFGQIYGGVYFIARNIGPWDDYVYQIYKCTNGEIKCVQTWDNLAKAKREAKKLADEYIVARGDHYENVKQLKMADKARNGHFFDKDKIKYGNDIFYNPVYNGGYFIMSRQIPYSPREWMIYRCEDGQFRMAEEVATYYHDSYESAHEEVLRLARNYSFHHRQ